MLQILAILFGGILTGAALRRAVPMGRHVPDTGGVMMYVVWCMLWAFGVSIGQNAELMGSLNRLGVQALVIGTASTAGSVGACMLLERLTNRSRGLQSTACETESRLGRMLEAMRGSLIIVGIFVVGLATGVSGVTAGLFDAGKVAEWLLYGLMGLVGIGLGSNPQIDKIKRGTSVWILLVAPVSVAGTALAAAIAGWAVSGMNSTDSIAAASGMGYYSLSSLLISKLKVASLGAEGALELGAIALLSNIIREMLTLIMSPLIGRYCGTYALVGAAGVTSIDVTLPSIRTVCGEGAVGVALVNGIMLEMSSPLLITLACMI